MREYLGNECFFCGEEEYLHFHHVNPEEKSYTVTSKYSYAWDTLVLELDKCILLCDDCHKDVHRPKELTHNRWRFVKYKCRCMTCKLDWNTYRRERRALGKS